MALPRIIRLKSIRTALVLPFILSFVTAVVLITALVFLDSRKAMDDILSELQRTLIAMVETDMSTRINEAIQLNQLNYDRLAGVFSLWRIRGCGSDTSP